MFCAKSLTCFWSACASFVPCPRQLLMTKCMRIITKQPNNSAKFRFRSRARRVRRKLSSVASPCSIRLDMKRRSSSSRKSAKKDPACAMAHWGIAMSLFHQIWERPQESTLKRGQEEIEKAQKIGAKTERERDYIAALALFYRDPASNRLLAARLRPTRTRWGNSTSNIPPTWRQAHSMPCLCWRPASGRHVARGRKEGGRSAHPAVPAAARSSRPGALHYSCLRFAANGAHRDWPPPAPMRKSPRPQLTRSTCHRTFSPGWDSGKRISRPT